MHALVKGTSVSPSLSSGWIRALVVLQAKVYGTQCEIGNRVHTGVRDCILLQLYHLVWEVWPSESDLVDEHK